jgi:hypothetical protein
MTPDQLERAAALLIDLAACLRDSRPASQSRCAPGTSAMLAAPYVLIPKAAELTGYSPRAIREKISRGVWLEGREYVKGADGHVLISMKGYAHWCEQGNKPGKRRSRSDKAPS